MAEPSYVFAKVEQQKEFERLRLQERVVDWMSMGALSYVGIGPGARCLEAGVGAGSITRWMAERVGPDGRVLGVDLNDTLFDGSRNPNTELRRDDLRTTPLEPASFDYVHCRTLLLHLEDDDRKALLAWFLQALRPGGWLVALDPALRVRGVRLLGPERGLRALPASLT